MGWEGGGGGHEAGHSPQLEGWAVFAYLPRDYSKSRESRYSRRAGRACLALPHLEWVQSDNRERWSHPGRAQRIPFCVLGPIWASGLKPALTDCSSSNYGFPLAQGCCRLHLWHVLTGTSVVGKLGSGGHTVVVRHCDGGHSLAYKDLLLNSSPQAVLAMTYKALQRQNSSCPEQKCGVKTHAGHRAAFWCHGHVRSASDSLAEPLPGPKQIRKL